MNPKIYLLFYLLLGLLLGTLYSGAFVLLHELYDWPAWLSPAAFCVAIILTPFLGAIVKMGREND